MMISLALLAAVATGPAFAPPGTYRYSASLHGTGTGSWSLTVQLAGGDTEIDEDSTASVAGMQLAGTAALVLGPDLSPVRYTATYHATGQVQTVNVVLTPASATMSGGAGGATRTLALEPKTQHFAVIDAGLLAGLFVLPAQLAAWRDASVTWLSPVTSEEQTISVAQGAAAPRPSGVPDQDAVLAMQGSVPFTIWYDPQTFVPDAVSVPSLNALVTRLRS